MHPYVLASGTATNTGVAAIACSAMHAIMALRQAWISTVNKLIFSRSRSKKCFLKIFEVWVCVSSVLRAVHVRTLHYTVLECQKQCHKCHTVCKPWAFTSTDREFTFLHFQLRRVSTAIQIAASSHTQNLLTLRPIFFDILVLHNIEKKSTLISRGRRAHLDHHMDTSKLCTDFGSRVLFFANRDPKSVATFQLLVFHETMRANAFQRPTQLLKGLYK